MAAPPYANRIHVGQIYTFHIFRGVVTGTVNYSGPTAAGWEWEFVLGNVAGFPPGREVRIAAYEIIRIVHRKADGTAEVIYHAPAGGRRQSHRRRSHRRRSHRRRSHKRRRL